MRMLTVRLPETLVADIEEESRTRRISRSDVVRERLQHASRSTKGRRTDPLAPLAGLVGSVGGLPADLSSRTKRHLRTRGYGTKRPR